MPDEPPDNTYALGVLITLIGVAAATPAVGNIAGGWWALAWVAAWFILAGFATCASTTSTTSSSARRRGVTATRRSARQARQ